jgi:hypothetical protein
MSAPPGCRGYWQYSLIAPGQLTAGKASRGNFEAANRMAIEEPKQMVDPKLHCSLCGRSEDDAKHLIAGPEVNVCDDCVLCMAEILAGQHPEWRDTAIERISRSSDWGHSLLSNRTANDFVL